MGNEVIKLRETNEIIICSVFTDFTIVLEKTIQDIYADICEKGYKKILIEFNPKNHITSGGMAILISLLSEGRKRNQKFGITGISDHFKKTFGMIGITRYMTIYDSTEEAIKQM